jgi:hypothetical protein
MKFRMNGHTFRSASDIAQIIASIPTEDLPVCEKMDRVNLYCRRFDEACDITTGEPLTGDDRLQWENLHNGKHESTGLVQNGDGDCFDDVCE